MVPSSAIIVPADGKHLTCGGFSLGETVCLGNFEFNADYFGGLSLSPMRGDAGATFMGTPHSGASTPRQTMIEDSIEEFLTVSNEEGTFGPTPLSQKARHWGSACSCCNHTMVEGHPRHRCCTAGGELPPVSDKGFCLESLGHFIEPAKSYS
jgi:hypothetical protein